MIARRILFTAMVIVALVVLTDTALSGQTAGVLRANAKHEIVLDKPAIVDNTLLPPGTYKVHSQASSTTHQVYFMREVTLRAVFPETSSVVVYDEAARVKSDTKLRSNVAEITELHYVEEDGTMHIVSADIKGESHSHIFGHRE